MSNVDWGRLFTSPEGRINRQQWWIGIGIVFVAGYIMDRVFADEGLGMVVVGLVLLAAAVMVHIKRCHDRGKSGWWALLILIPLVGVVWAVIDLGILEGSDGDNAYGPNPLRG